MCSYQMTPNIPTERLRLRAPKMADAARIATFANDLDVSRMTSRMPHPYDIADANSFLTGLNDPTSKDEATFAIELPGEGLIGVLGFHDVDAHGTPEIGYWLGKPWWGKGLATEAVNAALKWAKEGWRRKIVLGGHFADNPASGAVLIKSDFLYTGEVRKTLSTARGEVTPTRMMVWLA